MTDIRCQCGKILCQREEYIIVIKCRHCKRTMNIGLKAAQRPPEGHTVGAKQIVYKSKVAVSM